MWQCWLWIPVARAMCDDEYEASEAQMHICNRQCVYVKGRVQPSFDKWESYCVNTFGSGSWGSECEYYYSCVFGCNMFGGSSSKKYEEGTTALKQSLLENVNVEAKCDALKCKAYCVRSALDTCREEQYREYCTFNSLMGFYKCDADCNTSVRMVAHMVVLMAMILWC
eukprot:GEMP01043773.1.p1 GENE.GEMP01043773.1~~GEMP01043773.1.p1  ORF type:complete len:168 (+),score=36.61 GEMP01043773.1:163-666(+)